MRYITLIFLLALPLAKADLFGSSKYPIKLKRPLRTGMEFNSVITLETETGTTAQAGAPRTQSQKLTFECRIKVIAVASEHWQQLEVTPTKVDIEPSKKDAPTFRAIDSTIIIKRIKDRVNFSCGTEEQLLPFDIGILKQLFPPPNELDPDRAFGTNQEVKPGDSWEVNKEETSKLLKQSSNGAFNIAPDNVRGSLTLAREWKDLGKRYLQIGGVIRFDKVTVSSKQMRIPPESSISAVLQLNYQIPLESSLPAVKMKEDFAWKLTGPRGTLATNRMSRTQTIELTKIPDQPGE